LEVTRRADDLRTEDQAVCGAFGWP